MDETMKLGGTAPVESLASHWPDVYPGVVWSQCIPHQDRDFLNFKQQLMWKQGHRKKLGMKVERQSLWSAPSLGTHYAGITRMRS